MTMSFILPTSAHFPAVSPQLLHGFTKPQLPNGKSRTGPGRQFPRAQSDELEVERDLSRDRPRRNVVRTAESGKEVVERHLVHQVDDGYAHIPLALVAVEGIVEADRGIEKIARGNARRIVIVALGFRCRHLNQGGPELRCRTHKGERTPRRSVKAAAVEARFILFIRGKGSAIAKHLARRLAIESGRSRTVVARFKAITRGCARHLSTVI